MHDRTYSPDVESTRFARAGLPDDPNWRGRSRLDRRPAASTRYARAAALRSSFSRAPNLLCTRCGRDDEPPFGSALFPEIPTWSDEQLIVAIELADRREPGLNLYAVGNLPDRHDAFLNECAAELVRRLEEQGVRFAA